MNVTDAIAQRRSIKKFEDRPLTREEIEPLLDAAVLAPNHKLTQPWRFYVLGPEARRRYGLALGERKARKLTDPEAANAMREKTAAESSRRAAGIFARAEGAGLFLALAELPAAFFGDPWGAGGTVTALRSVLMKPEHRDAVPEIARLLSAITA